MGDCIKIISLLLLLQPQMTSLNFLNRVLVALLLILLTILNLKMQTLLNLIKLYFLNLKTLFIIKLLISYLLDTQKGVPKVIIQPSFQSYFISLKLAFSLAVIKTINNSTLPLMVTMNCSLKSIRYWQFCDPFRQPLLRHSCGISITIVLELQSPFRAC